MYESKNGYLALESGYRLPLQVLMSVGGFYIGTADESGPVSRESFEYFASKAIAQKALSVGNWTQRYES